MAVLNPNRVTTKIAFCLSKSENHLVLSQLILNIVEQYKSCDLTPLRKLYVIGDTAFFIDKGIEEIIKPDLTNGQNIKVERLLCNVHFEKTKKPIICKKTYQ